MTPREIEVWNLAVRACQELVISDGVQLHPELVELLEMIIKCECGHLATSHTYYFAAKEKGACAMPDCPCKVYRRVMMLSKPL